MSHLSDLLSHLDETVHSMRSAWDVPGAGVSIVKEDTLVYASGFGHRDIDRLDPVDEHSLFAIGSLTKAFTATAIGLLVQEGRLGWDDSVTRYLPGFQLSDPIATRQITVRDLLCHRSGLGTFQGDLMGYGTSYTRQQLLERVRHIPLAFPLRAGYGYANLMYVAAGEIIPVVSGLTWEEFVQQRLLEPLDMRRTLVRTGNVLGMENVAQPHQVYDGRLVRVPYLADTYGPAGTLVSSVTDLATWLRFQLNNGRVGGDQLVDEAMLEETRTPHTLMPIPRELRRLIPRRHFAAYGLGWRLSDYAGRLVVEHTGGCDGMLSLAAFLPEEQFAVAILTNRLPNSMFIALFRHILDVALGFHDRDWQAEFLELDRVEREKAAAQKKALEESRLLGTRPGLPLEAYTGNYRNDIYGPVEVSLEDGQLTLHLLAHAGVSGALEHWHLDTFFTRWSSPSLEESFVTFHIGVDGKVASLRLKVADFVDPLEYVFEKEM